MFFLLGSLVGETPCEHGENMQTPHRKAREIAQLSTVHSGEDLPPRANSAPCGNRTHDLLVVRRQCKHLSHRATKYLLLYLCVCVCARVCVRETEIDRVTVCTSSCE